MRKQMKAVLSVFLICVLTFSTSAFAFAAPGASADCGLRFNDDGKFTILQFADCQDDILPRKAMIMFMEKALDSVKPDLVVFTGDNCGVMSTKALSKLAINAFLKPVIDRKIQFTFVFGNHDAEKVSKNYQMGIYQSKAGCLAYDADPAIYGVGTHNLAVKSSDGTRDAFNLWLIDSNMYDDVLGGYDYVHEDQIEWYKKTCKALEKKNGAIVPSLMFQHICVPETAQLLVEATADDGKGTREYNGKKYIMKLNPELAQGSINEWPSPSNSNAGQLDACADTGDVLGIVTGHDHVNSFIGTLKGIDLIQTPGIGFQTYGDRQGYRVITLNENDAWNYETQVYTFDDTFGENLKAKFIYKVYGSEIGAIAEKVISTVKNLLNSIVAIFVK